jgi:hypothetical protein
MLAYRNRNSPLIYPIGLVNKGFTLSLTFSSAPILSGLDILSDALFDWQSYDNAIMAAEI